jgi:hypothetical protein
VTWTWFMNSCSFGINVNYFTLVMMQHAGIGEFIVWFEYCKKFKLLHISFGKNMIWSSILCERLRFSQPVIWKVVFDVVHCIEKQTKRKEKEKESNPSNEMKVNLSKKEHWWSTSWLKFTQMTLGLCMLKNIFLSHIRK